MNVQDIFNKVIESGIYPHQEGYMCHALTASASHKGIITQKEWYAAREAIYEYLEELASFTLRQVRSVVLYKALSLVYNEVGEEYQAKFKDRATWDNVKTMPQVCLSIYQDWDNRPRTAEAVVRLIDKHLGTEWTPKKYLIR